MTELTDFKIIVTTVENLTTPIITKLVFLYMIFYFYAIIGATIFGGEINSQIVNEKSPLTPYFYYLMNFNSYGSSLITLFHFMVVNNWNITIDMYQNVLDAYYYPVIFFVTFWCFVVLIILNVLIALIIEIYNSVEPDVTAKDARRKLAI